MRLTINETSNAKKVTGKTWPEFIRNIESNFGLNIMTYNDIKHNIEHNIKHNINV